MTRRYEVSAVNAVLCGQAEMLVSLLYPERLVAINGREIRIGRRGSLAVDRRKGVFYDNEAAGGGDMLALVMHARGCGFRDALEWADGFLGGRYTPLVRHAAYVSDTKERERNRKRTERARRIWAECCPIHGTLAEQYLREQRGITIDPPPSLRFHPGLPYARDPRLNFPALVAAVQNVDRKIIGVQATYLDPKTGNKIALYGLPARLSIGVVKGGAVRLARVQERLPWWIPTTNVLRSSNMRPGCRASRRKRSPGWTFARHRARYPLASGKPSSTILGYFWTVSPGRRQGMAGT